MLEPVGSFDHTRLIASRLPQSDVFREYRAAFEVITGLPLIWRRPGAYESPLSGSPHVNPFCALMAQDNRTCAACLQLQQRVEDAATHEPKTFRCFAGLSESAVPVRVGENLVGYLQTGQVFLVPPTSEGFARILREMGDSRSPAELQEMEAAYFQTRIMEKRHYAAVIRLLRVFAQHLATVCNQILITAAKAERPAMTRARAFIEENQSENLRLQEVARAVNMSAFYFCKLFKKVVGLTFTEYLARLRVESVKQMLLNPHTRVCEAAYSAGFQSLSQFNRVFVRVVGESPSDYRSHLSRPPRRRLRRGSMLLPGAISDHVVSPPLPSKPSAPRIRPPLAPGSLRPENVTSVN